MKGAPGTRNALTVRVRVGLARSQAKWRRGRGRAAQGGKPGRACSAMDRSRPKSWVLDSGSRMSFCSRDPRLPPTQYSRISHRWLVVSYLRRPNNLSPDDQPRCHSSHDL